MPPPGEYGAAARLHPSRRCAGRLLLPLPDPERPAGAEREPRQGPADPAGRGPAGSDVLDRVRRVRADVPAGDPEREQISYNPQVETAYQSAKAAFRDYLKNYNDGRGFIMLGHSQGSAAHRTPDRRARRHQREVAQALRRRDRTRRQHQRPDRRGGRRTVRQRARLHQGRRVRLRHRLLDLQRRAGPERRILTARLRLLDLPRGSSRPERVRGHVHQSGAARRRRRHA